MTHIEIDGSPSILIRFTSGLNPQHFDKCSLVVIKPRKREQNFFFFSYGPPLDLCLNLGSVGSSSFFKVNLLISPPQKGGVKILGSNPSDWNRRDAMGSKPAIVRYRRGIFVHVFTHFSRKGRFFRCKEIFFGRSIDVRVVVTP